MKFTPEQKSALVHAYLHGESVLNLCQKHNLSRSTLYNWIRESESKELIKNQSVTLKQFRQMTLRQQKLENLVEILQKVDVTTSSPLQDRLNALENLYGDYDVHTLCESLLVDRGTFYNHIKRAKKGNSSHQLRRAQLSQQIKEIYENSNQIFGAKKIRNILSQQGIPVSDEMVRELMREMNLTSIRFGAKSVYNKKHNNPKKDHLQRQFNVSTPNQVWASDVTYFKFHGRFYYICAILDLYARKVIAHKISIKHSTQLISGTFKLAYTTRKPTHPLIFHSDRGTQYSAHSFQKLLHDLDVEQSFSPSGSPHHNAVMESFFASLKREELYRTDYRSLDEFKRRTAEYIKFYNNERPHSTLHYKTPDAVEALYFQRIAKEEQENDST
ncbi:MAG: IS3 family transposase [Eubacteriales bacterium]